MQHRAAIFSESSEVADIAIELHPKSTRTQSYKHVSVRKTPGRLNFAADSATGWASEGLGGGNRDPAVSANARTLAGHSRRAFPELSIGMICLLNPCNRLIHGVFP